MRPPQVSCLSVIATCFQWSSVKFSLIESGFYVFRWGKGRTFSRHHAASVRVGLYALLEIGDGHQGNVCSAFSPSYEHIKF